VKQRQGKQKLK